MRGDSPSLPKGRGHWALPILRFFLTPFLKPLGPVFTSGESNMPHKGGVIVVMNHISDVDPILVQWASPRPIYFMAKASLYEGFVGWVLRTWACFPVEPDRPDRKSLRLAIAYAKAGEPVGIFPEGQLSEDAHLQPLKGGVALIIRQSQVPVICCGIHNSQLMMPYGTTTLRRAGLEVNLHWGEIKKFTQESDEEILGWLAAELRRLSQ